MTQLALQSEAGGPNSTGGNPPRSYPRQVLRATFAKTGAKLGLAWLTVVAAGAVFGPFFASSYPWVVHTTDGVWHFPLLRYLKPADVILPLLLATAIALLLLTRLPAGRRWLIFGATSVLVTLGSLLFVHAPQRETFDEYHRLVESGKVRWAVTAPIPYSPRDRQSGQNTKPPSAIHRMGTETFGSDVFSRMIHACRIALAVGFIATGIALVIGITLGGLMGYFSGTVDILGMRIVEIFSAIPTFFLLLTLIAVMPPEWNPYRLYVIMVIIGLTSWVGYARFTRAEFLKLRKQDFVQAAIASGLPLHSILFKHMLPNGVAPVLVEASFGVAGAILTEATLSFIGLGLVDEPSWGQMLNQATGATGDFAWWLAFFPGMAIFLTVFAYNLVGEALRDAIDPHTQK